jgi:type II secretory pathway pseudopilin PulG
MTKRRKRGRGFSLIEVIVALLVYMVAMLGLVALQRASVAGANIGREQTAAVDLARFAMTWLEAEAAAWPLADATLVPDPEQLPLLGAALNEEDAWQSLTSGNVRFDAYMEHSATPLYADVDSAQYCVHYRVKPLGADEAEEDPVAYQVWVRVTWPRWGQYKTDGTADWNDCDARLGAGSSVIGAFEVVELTGVATREYTGRWTEEE